MRRFFVLVALLIVATVLYSQDYLELAKEPCYGIELGSDWEGPKEFTICSDSLSNDLFCNHCCFTVVYYDMYTPEPNDEYYISVVGIFFSGQADCYNCNKEAIINTFYECKLKHLSVYPDVGKPTMEDLYGPNLYGHTMTYSTPGSCKTSGGENCDTNLYCCTQNMQVVFDSNFHVVSAVPALDLGISPECSAPCITFCKDIPYLPINFPTDPSDCDVPCDTGDWTNSVEFVPIEDCQGCTVRVDFRYRTTSGPLCNPPYLDYQVIQMTKEGCDNCNMTGSDMFEYCINWLLKFGPHAQPNPGWCKYNYRVIHASCWEWHNDTTFIPCIGSGCCWSIYKICNPLRPGIDPEKIAQSDNDTLNCPFIIGACLLMCNSDLPRISSPNEDLITKDKSARAYISPNPNNCTATLTIDNGFKGDIVLEISNSLGELIIKEKYLKTSYNININISIANCTNGTYFYRILQNEIKVGEGSFVVVK